MWGIKRRNSSNLITCGAPANKVPKPPVSNDDSSKPSFLKALEAVVAAGRLGLLGPAAMAAVGAMPDLEAEGHDGKVGQETPSSIPLLGEEEEGKKGEKEEEKEGEEEEKAEKEEERKGEEEENAGKKKRKKKGKNIVNMEIAFTPPMNGKLWINEFMP
ncbi:UNVERIFIED_CONTAM: hypothetical protein K2H54_063074 [Gekko kuhli]